MKTVKFTTLQCGEAAHKLCIVRDEDDLLDSYEITEEQADNSVTIYPNPFDNTATLHISNVSGNVSLALYDVLGKEVKNITNIKNENIQINRDNLPDGIYFYQVRNNNNTIATGKIVLANSK